MTGSTEQTVPTTQNSTTNTGPLAGTGTGILNTYNGILSALGSYNSSPYSGSTVAPLSGTTTGLVGTAAGLGNTAAGISSTTNNALMQQLQNGTINSSATALYGAGVNAANASLPYAGNIANQAVDANQQIGNVLGSTSAIANGSLLANGGANTQFNNLFNPAANAVTQQYETGIAPGIASQYALAGRSGSGAQAAATASAQDTYKSNLNNLASEALAQTYGTDVNAQTTAQGLVGSLSGQQVQNAAVGQGAITSALGNIANQDTTAAGGVQNQTTDSAQLQQQAASALSSTNATDLNSVLGSLQASGVIDANTQQQLTGAISQYYAGNNQALTKYSQFLPLLTQIASLGQSGTTAAQGTTTAYGASPLSQVLGGAAGLGSLATGIAKII